MVNDLAGMADGDHIRAAVQKERVVELSSFSSFLAVTEFFPAFLPCRVVWADLPAKVCVALGQFEFTGVWVGYAFHVVKIVQCSCGISPLNIR